MPTQSVPYRETGYFSDLICDYLDKREELQGFYHRYPSLENFEEQILEKQKAFTASTRQVLVNRLKAQYAGFDTTDVVRTNIKLLGETKTFTVTTGHQLNLFTGPLYFLYKIVSTIKLSRKLKETYPAYDFVPVYWMATEDHDFDEINHFNFEGTKVSWNRADVQDNDGGAVGRLNLEGLEAVYELVCRAFGNTQNGRELCALFKKAYLGDHNLAHATRILANALFAKEGLVIVDGDDHHLKEVFAPYVKQELKEGISYEAVSRQAEKLTALGYDAQVTPREVNLFYLTESRRERILKRDGRFYVNGTDWVFTQEEMNEELQKHPERFSPNVIMRPLYQEVILPNLCYIGGGGELAYWLELKTYFEATGVVYPILLLRNSALLTSEKLVEKAARLHVSIRELFLDQNDLINRKIREISNIDIDFAPQKKHLVKQFEAMYELASKTDASFLGAVKAQEVKQLKGLDNLEHRLLAAQKRKLADEVQRLKKLQQAHFPNHNLQERNRNFSGFYLKFGEHLYEMLFESLNPFSQEFTVIITKD